VNLDHFRLFKDIAKEKSVTRGAQLNKISQSAASQHIQELERTLGVKLLDRTRRPLELTKAGELYNTFCRDVLRRWEEFEIALEQTRQRVEGVVRVASIYSVGLSEMAHLEEEFARKYPAADLRVEYLRWDKVYEAIREDRADIGLVSYPEPAKDISVIRWRKEVMLVAAPPDHPLAANTFLAPAALDGQDFIGFDDDLPIARELRRYFSGHGVKLNVTLRFDNVQTIKEAVALGNGISILPERVIRDEIAHDRLVGIPLESPGLYRELGIIHDRRKQFNRATQGLLRLLDKQPAGEGLLRAG